MSTEQTTISVCKVCRQGDDADSRPGQLFFEALGEKLSKEPGTSIRLEAVECLAVCKRPCTLAFSAPGKWTYVIGDLDSKYHVDRSLSRRKDTPRQKMALSHGRRGPPVSEKALYRALRLSAAMRRKTEH